MCILNFASTIKKMSLNEIGDFIFEKYYNQIGFSKKYSYCSMKQKKKIYNCLLLN